MGKGGNETVGIAVIVVGALLVIGAVRGTWRSIFAAALGQAGSSTTPTAFVATTTAPTNTANQTVNLDNSSLSQQTAPSLYSYQVGPSVQSSYA